MIGESAGLFQEADDNGNGTLDRQEFAAVLQNGRLGLSSQIVDRVLAEADDNEDGVIEYTCAHPGIDDPVQPHGPRLP